MTEPFESRDLAERYCPGCEPERDPLQGIAVVQWCCAHEPAVNPNDAEERARLGVSEWWPSAGNGEPAPSTNRAACALIHRSARVASALALALLLGGCATGATVSCPHGHITLPPAKPGHSHVAFC